MKIMFFSIQISIYSPDSVTVHVLPRVRTPALKKHSVTQSEFSINEREFRAGGSQNLLEERGKGGLKCVVLKSHIYHFCFFSFTIFT